MPKREIKSSRLKFLGYLAGSLTFVGLIVWMFNEGVDDTRRTWFWFGLLFFGLCSIVFLGMIIRPMSLLLDGEGFTLSGGLIRSPKKVRWKDIGEFYVYRVPRSGTMVGYNFRPGARPESVMLELNRKLGAEAALPSGWPMSAEQMVDELNAFRAQALSASS